MKKKSLVMSLLALTSLTIQAQSDFVANYDEGKVPAYTLPSLLTCNDGTQITTSAEWENKRRPEVMELFQSMMFGRTPQEKVSAQYTLLKENPQALNGKATIQQVRMRFSNNGKSHDAILMLVKPNHAQRSKLPVIFCYNFLGNEQTLGHDSSILPHAANDVFPITVKGKDEEGYGSWDFDQIMDRGYVLATMCYHDIYPDGKNDLRKHSVATLFSDYVEESSMQPDTWQSIGMWAWGASRAANYLVTLPWIDADRMAVMGHSRLGKTALWTGAQDTRFRVVISNDSGCGGAALSRRCFGETIGKITDSFPHWFCPLLSQYDRREQELPFDQHQLLALVAPRGLYVASAEDDAWADQRGEFLAACAAGEVYHLYGLKGLETTVMPAIHQPITNSIAYHIRAGIHDVTTYDWTQYLNFCDKQFKLQ